jgi:hypothetical protein
MTSRDPLLDLIRSTSDIHGLLRASFGFDIERKRCGDGLRLASGCPAGADRRGFCRWGVFPVGHVPPCGVAAIKAKLQVAPEAARSGATIA